MFVYLFHGTDEVLSWLADVASHSTGSPSLEGRVGTVLAVYLHSVTSFGRPPQLVVHDKVHGKHV